jgi:hypothetical protein
MVDLKQCVVERIHALGVKEASKFYGVSVGTVSNWASGKTSPSVEAVQLTIGEAEPQPSDELTMWQGRKVGMLLPVYKTMNPDTHFTLFANYVQYGPEKIAMPKPVKGTCIWEARNKLIDKAMKIEGLERFIMSDDDMIYPHGHVESFNSQYGAGVPAESAGLNAISRICSHSPDKGVVGALYFGRHERGRAQCHLGFTDEVANEKLRRCEYKGLVPMPWVGTGWMKIERWVIDKMKAAIDGGMWPECKPSVPGAWYGYFNPIAVGVGEDLSFCRRAGEIGIQVYLDASLIALHVGDTAFGPRNTHK